MPVPEAGLTAEKADPASSTRTPESKKPSRMNWAKCLILLGWPTGLEPATTGITIRHSTPRKPAPILTFRNQIFQWLKSYPQRIALLSGRPLENFNLQSPILLRLLRVLCQPYLRCPSRLGKQQRRPAPISSTFPHCELALLLFPSPSILLAR
jgi:hypothetical protein